MFLQPASHGEPGLTLVLNWPHHEPVLDVIARLALAGPVRVIVGGNRFDAPQLARVIRRHTVHLDQTLARIEVVRPFTCYQTVTLLAETAVATPLLFLDALTPFYDESISDGESQRLAVATTAQLRRLKQQAPLLVTLRPPPTPARRGLLKLVRGTADRVYVYTPPQRTVQPTLF